MHPAGDSSLIIHIAYTMSRIKPVAPLNRSVLPFFLPSYLLSRASDQPVAETRVLVIHNDS